MWRMWWAELPRRSSASRPTKSNRTSATTPPGTTGASCYPCCTTQGPPATNRLRRLRQSNRAREKVRRACVQLVYSLGITPTTLTAAVCAAYLMGRSPVGRSLIMRISSVMRIYPRFLRPIGPS
eukprot:1183812-Prorocentrum_minimum.AAC.1